MRPEPNNDIDLLLRQLARRAGSSVSEIEEQHLDADELNSYVAKALPPLARARYTEHLADCSSCRKLVAQLSAAEGPIAVPQSTAVVAPSGLKSFLANLFSPMVLRYAVPALGLVVISIIAIVVLRQDRRGSDVVQLTNTDQNQSVLQNQPTVEPSREIKTEQAPRRAAAPVAKDAPAPVGNEPVGKVITTAEAPPRGFKAAPAEEQAQKEKKAEAAQPASAADAEKQRADDAKNEARKVDEGAAAPGVAVASAPVTGKAESRPAKTVTSAGAGASTGSVSRETRDSSRARDEAPNAFAFSDTRSVAGRHFRKSGSMWIDTAYKSSSAVTQVVRGSEQYRALIADEPSIRTIAEQLEGQIIVVWKGRTYRIR